MQKGSGLSMDYKYSFTAELVLPASPEQIYEILIDPLKMSKYVPTTLDVTIVSNQTKGQGVISRWRSKRPDGSIAEWNETVAVAELNRRMVFKYLESSDTEGEYLLSPTPEGHTKVTFTEFMQQLHADEQWHVDHVKEILKNLERAAADL